ncbi:MAG: Holliday junction branch migration protein RuvA [Planctomycetes bacterium]|nr:Holliday junction branch migration protein RuvA [Planctomycetota bacterium]
MFEYIRGRVTSREPASVVLETGGIGYRILVPLPTSRELVEGRETTLFLHEHGAEDARILCGFATREDRNLFRTLLRVRGIGPKIALSILSALGRETFLRALAREDLSALTGVRGVGKKTAERILVELRDRLPDLESAPMEPRGDGMPEDAMEGGLKALLALGVDRDGARTALEEARREIGEPAGLGDLVRAALRKI